MRKNYLLIAAAAIVVAGCAQNESLVTVENNDYPTVIGFNTLSENATRASVEALEKYHGTFAVYATKKSTNSTDATPEVVFCGDSTALTAADIITFDPNRMAPNNWTYSPYRYWDKQANYHFIAVAPNAKIIKFDKPTNVADNAGTFRTVNPLGYTLVGQNLQSNDEPAESEIKVGFKGGKGQDTDLMTSGKITRSGSVNTTEDVSLQFKHILAKLNIAMSKDKTFDNVKVLIKSIKITGLDDNGTYEEAVSDDHSGWHSAVVDPSYTLSWENANGIELPKGTGSGNDYQPGKTLYFIESLIMPQTIEEKAEKLTIEYTDRKSVV